MFFGSIKAYTSKITTSIEFGITKVKLQINTTHHLVKKAYSKLL